MKTVASIVEQYLKTKPFLLSSLSQGIINLTSLARIMMPEVELHLGKDIKQGAVVMALKRISEELEFRMNYKISRVLNNVGEITVRSSLIDYTYSTSPTLLDNQAKLISDINKMKDVFYTSSRGVNETNIVVSDTVGPRVDELFKTEKLIAKTDNLSSVSIKLPQENVSVPGVYYIIFQALAWEGVVIKEVISSTNEFTIIVDEQQVDVAFKVIKDIKKMS
jgi:aspartokinase